MVGWCVALRQHRERLLKTGKLTSCDVLIPTNRVSEVKTSQPNIRY